MRLLPSLLLLSPLVTWAETPPRPYGLVIHGGAGVIARATMTPERETEYRARLTEALNAGYAVLDRSGAAVEAVTAAINVMEDSPLFNAGKGAVFNADGICELDASIMDGRTQAAGAIAGVHHIRNPINLARDVMLKSPHVMMAGEGAEKFARSLGYELVPNEYFQTDWRREQLKKAQAKEKDGKERTAAAPVDYFARTLRWGTVGCVALDKAGNLAAGTSTGGMTNKKFGRVGDAPIIGAGTYAHNATCAVSATGWGEYFIRVGVARDIAAQMEYKGTPLREAAAATIAKVGQLGGDGGVIALDAQGNIAMEFNSPGMYRAARLSNRPAFVAIYGDEKTP
ncbi:MAG TPA: isoaspartyl peptidase/L-asparaginase [Lacunisphaera sp.]|jgi:beta-aspartyl-peptidase (threonine type)|nr:isoaspartyl peptidase/L-asparaginase [Lacunisphaera sp.]HQY04830.1 isoaspartyl peptidase/L-asparaginase [Lacunisphaera sp.]